jgi:hypothetical protein
MAKQPTSKTQAASENDADLSDLLQELRVLLPGTQTLAAFLIILPFTEGFDNLQGIGRVVYVATFVLALIALVLFTAPAAHHRLQRPLKNRAAFKEKSTKIMIAGLIPFSLALILSADLTVSIALNNELIGLLAASIVSLFLLVMWWILPIREKMSKS